MEEVRGWKVLFNYCFDWGGVTFSLEEANEILEGGCGLFR